LLRLVFLQRGTQVPGIQLYLLLQLCEQLIVERLQHLFQLILNLPVDFGHLKENVSWKGRRVGKRVRREKLSTLCYGPSTLPWLGSG